MSPLVSICLPNLNTRRYLPERFDSIAAQTLVDWELIVSDNYSDDGAWEYIRERASADPRIDASQAPREGMYANWNRCIARARGKYVYIATSDDTMAPDCLARMVDALERLPECGLAHCTLVTIDAAGRTGVEPRWPDCTAFAAVDPTVVRRRHLRRAPYDGLLHLTGRIAYQSLTQLLIRRELFDRIGLFPTRWGSVGDIHWDMRAALVADVVHVPDTWASFRVHDVQATAGVDFLSTGYAEKFDAMVEDAFRTTRHWLDPQIAAEVERSWLAPARDLRNYYLGLRRRNARGARRRFQAGHLLRGPASVRREIVGRFGGGPRWPEVAPARLRAWLEHATGRPVVEDASW